MNVFFIAETHNKRSFIVFCKMVSFYGKMFHETEFQAIDFDFGMQFFLKNIYFFKNIFKYILNSTLKLKIQITHDNYKNIFINNFDMFLSYLKIFIIFLVTMYFTVFRSVSN